jgi:hypothetical protein
MLLALGTQLAEQSPTCLCHPAIASHLVWFSPIVIPQGFIYWNSQELRQYPAPQFVCAAAIALAWPLPGKRPPSRPHKRNLYGGTGATKVPCRSSNSCCTIIHETGLLPRRRWPSRLRADPARSKANPGQPGPTRSRPVRSSPVRSSPVKALHFRAARGCGSALYRH